MHHKSSHNFSNPPLLQYFQLRLEFSFLSVYKIIFIFDRHTFFFFFTKLYSNSNIPAKFFLHYIILVASPIIIKQNSLFWPLYVRIYVYFVFQKILLLTRIFTTTRFRSYLQKIDQMASGLWIREPLFSTCNGHQFKVEK